MWRQMLWTWEQVGPVTSSFSYNIVVERLVHCNNPALLQALFLRLWSVAAQRDRATAFASAKMRQRDPALRPLLG